MSRNGWKFLILIILVSFISAGCYYLAAKQEIENAEKFISQLKGEGGPTLVPYEYCSAEAFLASAKMEADQGDWKHAKGFASRSKSAAEAGLAELKKKK